MTHQNNSVIFSDNSAYLTTITLLPLEFTLHFEKPIEPNTENFSSTFKGVHDLPQPFILNVYDIQNESTDELKPAATDEMKFPVSRLFR